MTDDPRSRSFFRDRQSHEWFAAFPGERVTFHVNGQNTDAKFSVGEALIEPGNGQPLHIHHNIDELLYVLEGEIDFLLDGKRARFGPGGFAFIARGSPHAFRNLSSTVARMLGVFSPTGIDGFFDAMAGQPLEALPDIAQRFGIEIIGPMIEPIDA
jgi:mannose-6-phosphate isomerase-like protein (cupin superfamily)